MATFLFDEIIFGPVTSRRLGSSLGINLLPVNCKICNFNCIYCECGWTSKQTRGELLDANSIEEALEKKLKELKAKNIIVDTITFAGNGEPTMHPEFDIIIEFTNRLKDKYYPGSEVAVLSNATMINNERVFKALEKVDQNILKLDSSFEKTVHILNKPSKSFSLQETIENLKRFNGNFILQTMFVKGQFEGSSFDNTSDEEINAWLKLVNKLQPKQVMIYTIKRDTPVETISAIPAKVLNEIARKVKSLGIDVQVSD